MSTLKEDLTDEAKKIGYEYWCANTFPKIITLETGGDGKARSSEFEAVIFSPYSIPHALVMHHTYFKKVGWILIESRAHWGFRLHRFDFEDDMQNEETPNYDDWDESWKRNQHGDKVQRELMKNFPPDVWDYKDPLYSEGFETLCCTYIDGSPNHGAECSPETWLGVEKIVVSNFDPSTVCRMKRWLFGSVMSSTVLSDFDFLRLVFASCGSANFTIANGYIGYFWSPSKEVEEELRTFGIEATTLSWLEYQARWASGAIRPQDTYYEHYNDLKEKALWGKWVLKEQEKNKCEDNENESEEENLWKAPWLVWKRAETGEEEPQMFCLIETIFTWFTHRFPFFVSQ